MAKDWAKPFYASAAWNKCRTSYLQSVNYVCERCNDMATIVHHKIYLTPENIDDPYITLNWDHLEALCHTCHTLEHHSNGIVREGLSFDSNGNLIQV